ncbi:Phosphatidylinositol 4-phosphate 5-kinase 8 [Spatholobus suberectus]|nr:Phosphatidylinositol 4-phosphate 5-kinase 8 [Spatholobus suberectus]
MEDSGRCSFEEKSFSNGDVYIGKIKGILPHGKGRYAWSDGTVYEGDWIDGKMTGKGQITWPTGAKYEGEFSGAYLHGHGTFTHSTGCIYTGGWRMDAHHGLGRKVYSNSDIYEGLWKEGIREGCGRYSWKNGNMYIGNWKSGQIDGRGVMKWANGDIFDGCWLNGLRQGSGVYRFADGGLYIGTWSKGLKDGKGTFYPAGCKQPSLKKLCSLNSVDSDLLLNTEKHTAPKPKFTRSFSEKISVSRRSKSSRQISHRTSSLDENWNLHDPSGDCICRDSSPTLSQTFNESQSEASGMNSLVYEREYMQGVLIMERIRNYSETSHKNKRQNKFSVKQVKKSSWIDIFGGRQTYYLKLNLQLGIRYTVGKITPVPAREVRSSDFGDRARIRMYFPKEGSQLTPPHCSIDFYWKDYCPMVFRQISLDCMFLESQRIIDYSLLLGLHFRAPENLKALVEPPRLMQPPYSLPSGDDDKQGEQLIIPKGLLLVAHEPSFVNTAPGPHIRGNTLRAYSIGDKQVDLLLPGTARLRVQLGVNMPAQATRKLQEDRVEESEVELFEVYDVVLYMGIIDILQEYNVRKKLEHACKSLQA